METSDFISPKSFKKFPMKLDWSKHAGIAVDGLSPVN